MQQNYSNLMNKIDRLFLSVSVGFSVGLIPVTLGCLPWFFDKFIAPSMPPKNLDLVRKHLTWVIGITSYLCLFACIAGIVAFGESILAFELHIRLAGIGAAGFFSALTLTMLGDRYVSLLCKIRALKRGSIFIGLLIFFCFLIGLILEIFLPAYVVIIICSVIVNVSLVIYLIQVKPK